MKDQEYELLSQYVDGELDEVTAQRVRARLDAEPALRETLDKLLALNARLRETFAGTDTVPESVAAMVRPSSNVVPLTRQRPARPAWQYAVAASLVAAAGLLLTPQWQTSTPSSPTLATVLESTPSMASGWATLTNGEQVRPVLSFSHIDGSWCREYLLQANAASTRGVACRLDDGQWQVRVAAAAELPGSSADFRPAGAGDADPVADSLADYSADIALSASEEQRLIEQAWLR